MLKEFKILRNNYFIGFTLSAFPFLLTSYFCFPSYNLGNISDLGSTPLEADRNIHKAFDTDKEDLGSVLTNPLELMNVIRQVGAMNDATLPSDAIDEALFNFKSQD